MWRVPPLFEWLAFASSWLVLWVIIYTAKPSLRKEMIIISFCTTPAALLEPVFIPAYWNPPSLFNLAATARFDLESFIFTFATGGIASVLYEVVLNVKHERLSETETFRERRWLHFGSLTSMFVIFPLLVLFTSMNPIYAFAISLFTAAIASNLCRPDLTKHTWTGGALFAMLYFAFFAILTLIFPEFINAWNLRGISGILIANVPLEEIMYAFTFGMFWSTVYEHAMRYRNTKT
jgi:hypothetical protein